MLKIMNNRRVPIIKYQHQYQYLITKRYHKIRANIGIGASYHILLYCCIVTYSIFSFHFELYSYSMFFLWCFCIEGLMEHLTYIS